MPYMAALAQQRIHLYRVGDGKLIVDSDAIFSMMAGMLNPGTATAVTVLVTVLLLAGALFVWTKL